MSSPNTNNLRQKLVEEFDVLEDDIVPTSSNDALTFYLPIDQLDQAKDNLDAEIDVLEEHEHEYLIRGKP